MPWRPSSSSASGGPTFGTEVRAGVTTFMVMVYIVALNGAILIAGPLGLDPVAVAAAGTALVAGVMTIAMGARRELSVRPGRGPRASTPSWRSP